MQASHLLRLVWQLLCDSFLPCAPSTARLEAPSWHASPCRVHPAIGAGTRKRSCCFCPAFPGEDSAQVARSTYLASVMSCSWLRRISFRTLSQRHSCQCPRSLHHQIQSITSSLCPIQPHFTASEKVTRPQLALVSIVNATLEIQSLRSTSQKTIHTRTPYVSTSHYCAPLHTSHSPCCPVLVVELGFRYHRYGML